MTDSVQIFHPGWRFVNELGVPYSGAKAKFYDAGTSNTRTVYSNSGLSSSLGSTVYTGSDGAPVASSGSSTEVMVYTGTSAYKIVFTTSADVEIFTLDNIRGALDTSTFLTTASTSTLTIPVASKTGDYTIVAGDRGKLINADASSATFTLTLTSAVTLGDNWSVLIRNTGTANPVKIAASQAISGPWHSIGSTNSFALRPGEGAFINCNGVTFQISAMAPAYLPGTVGVIEIADRVSAAPGSPVSGARYIVSAAFSTYEQEDIIETDGAGSFFEITPPTDCGWVAYVQDENAYYSFQGSAWVCLSATQTQMEAVTETGVFLTPANARFHPSAAKVWASCGNTGNILASYNVSSVTDSGTGQATYNFATAFSSAAYAAHETPTDGTARLGTVNTKGTTSILGYVSTVVPGAIDPTDHNFSAHGDL